MIFMLTSVFAVEASETKEKLKKDTKFTNLFELKAIVNESLKEWFSLATQLYVLVTQLLFYRTA